MQLIAKLQKKKNVLRSELARKGILKREGQNDFDRYKYFSEAQYKALFTELFSKVGLELSFDEKGYEFFEGQGKQPNGRLVKLEFELTDVDTGYSEYTTISAEAMDKGDKAGYKAYTGALKYYLANTFMVATGDDPETESPATEAPSKPAGKPAGKPEAKKADQEGPTDNQIALMRKLCEEQGAQFDEEAALKMTRKEASDAITAAVEAKKQKGAKTDEKPDNN